MVNRSPVGSLVVRYERRFGVWAFAHLCVSEAMREELDASWHIKYGPKPKTLKTTFSIARHGTEAASSFMKSECLLTHKTCR